MWRAAAASCSFAFKKAPLRCCDSVQVIAPQYARTTAGRQAPKAVRAYCCRTGARDTLYLAASLCRGALGPMLDRQRAASRALTRAHRCAHTRTCTTWQRAGGTQLQQACAVRLPFPTHRLTGCLLRDTAIWRGRVGCDSWAVAKLERALPSPPAPRPLHMTLARWSWCKRKAQLSLRTSAKTQAWLQARPHCTACHFKEREGRCPVLPRTWMWPVHVQAHVRREFSMRRGGAGCKGSRHGQDRPLPHPGPRSAGR